MAKSQAKDRITCYYLYSYFSNYLILNRCTISRLIIKFFYNNYLQKLKLRCDT